MLDCYQISGCLRLYLLGRWPVDVLAVCPDLFCRRSGLCRNQAAALPCRRTHEPMDAARDRLSAKLEWMLANLPPAHMPPLTGLAFERALSALKRGLEELDP